MLVAILIYEGFTPLDAVGPYQALAAAPELDVYLVGPTGGGPVIAEGERLALMPSASLADISAADALIVPGGEGRRALAQDERALGWIRRLHGHARLTASVCTGALVLGAAGLLEGRRATTHWAYLEELRRYGAEPVAERIVRDDGFITAAGVSAGIELGLALVGELCGEDAARAAELAIEYDPAPPFGTGSPARAPAHIVELVRSRERGPQA